MLGGVLPWERCEPLIEYDLASAVGTFDVLEKIAAFRGSTPLKVHVKLDTGMGRLGFGPAELTVLTQRLKGLRGVEIEGVMSHFPASERRDERGLRQVARFADMLELLKKHGIEPKFSAHGEQRRGLQLPGSPFHHGQAGDHALWLLSR